MLVSRSIPGLSVVLLVALGAFGISTIHGSFDALVISMLAGILIGNLIGHQRALSDGIELAVRFVLPCGIALYGTQLSVADLRWQEMVKTVAVFGGLFGLTFLLSRTFGLGRRMGILLAAGMSVCGTSAIAVISPLISARREETSISIISVIMLGLTGVILYPLLGDFLVLAEDEFAFFSGATLPMLGQVKVTAASVSADCMNAAVKIKLIRISLLLFIIPLAMILAERGGGMKVPFFIILFVVLALFVNVSNIFAPFAGTFRLASGFFLSTGLAAVGMSVDLDAIVDEGMKPLGIVLMSWGAVILAIYLARSIF